ncbi:hypothetical protein HPB48_005394 [Haemaphysalis longicornis]|uniref:Uncharacterized protein n=1 Tax=Haemaphysalis longicornis TaxID=44386 RepID=A0A9J6GFB6_HAELO|nr:hypothetical protein HPB48_005394 [Haemaphysalis longicornis]
MSALTKLRGLQSLRIQDTDIPLRAYLAAPTELCRGVIHGVEANTPPEELAANLISTGASIISARMMGRTETALITFAGSPTPRYVIYHNTEFRCYPQKPKAQFCSRCHKHRPPSGRLSPCLHQPCSAQPCSGISPAWQRIKQHDCVPKCRLCRGSSQPALRPSVLYTHGCRRTIGRRAYQRCLANRRSQSPALDMTSSDRHDRRHRSIVPKTTMLPIPDIYNGPTSQQRHGSRFHRHNRMFEFACQAILKPTGEVSQQLPSGHIPTLHIVLPPNHTIPELYALMVNLFSHFDRRLATIEEALDHRPCRKRSPPSKNSPPPPSSRDASPKGRTLATAISQGRFCLLNDPAFPTLLGNSVEHGTSPDLSFFQGTGNPSWSLLHESFGSDHSIIEIRLPFMRAQPRPGSRVALAGWHHFRLSDVPTIDPTNPDAWLRALMRNHDWHTKYVAPTADAPFIDPHLVHLWTRAAHSFAVGVGTKPTVACAVE